MLSLDPTVAYVIGQNMVFDASVLLYCALMLPVGIVCFMLNAIPADLSGGMVLAFFIAVYALIILVTGGTRRPLERRHADRLLRPGGLSVVGAAATSTVCCIPKGPKQSEKKLLRLWLTSRIFSILLGISFFFLLVDTTWHNSALISWNIATIVVGLEFDRLRSHHATMPLRTYHHDRNGRARRQRGGGRRCENLRLPPSSRTRSRPLRPR